MINSVIAFIDSPAGKILSFIAVGITILGIFKFSGKKKIMNELESVRISEDYIGGSSGKKSSTEESKIENKLKSVNIGGKYIGGDDNKS